MSYEKHVYSAKIPKELLAEWTREIKHHGILVEFHPEFELSSWRGGYLPCKLTVQPGAFESSHRYSTQPVSAGFEFLAILDQDEIAEFLDDYEEDMLARGDPLPQELIKRLRSSSGIFCFTHSGFSWTAADFRTCWFASAALAKVTDGILFDEWADDGGQGYSSGEQALLIAARRSARYEDDPDTQVTAWNITMFEGWEE